MRRRKYLNNRRWTLEHARHRGRSWRANGNGTSGLILRDVPDSPLRTDGKITSKLVNFQQKILRDMATKV